jgi:hypothetical protein
MVPGGVVSGDVPGVVVPVPGNGPAPGALGIVVPGPVVPPIVPEPVEPPPMPVPALPPELPPVPPPAPPPPPPPAWAMIMACGCAGPAACALEAGITENATAAAMPVIIIGDISLRSVSVIGSPFRKGGAQACCRPKQIVASQ